MFSYSVVQYSSSGVAKADISLSKEALGHEWVGGGNIGDLHLTLARVMLASRASRDGNGPS